MTAQVLGKPVRAGRLVRRLEKAKVEAAIERTSQGYILKGAVTGRPGRLEIFRTPAPPAFLLNNWQSWGPMERVTPSTRFPELEAIVRDYSPYLFSPQPDLLLRGPVSDYFTAWEGTVAGFLTSRIGHPYFTLEGGELVGWIDYFDAEFAAPVALEPLAVLSGGAVEDLLATYAGLVKRANRVRINPWNPVGWCSWYHYFGKLVWDDVLENLDYRGPRPEVLPLRRLPGRRRLRDRYRRLDVAQAGLSGSPRPGPGHRPEGIQSRDLDGAVQRGRDLGAIHQAPGMDGPGGRPAQALLPGLGKTDLRPRHDPSGSEDLASRYVHEASERRDLLT